MFSILSATVDGNWNVCFLWHFHFHNYVHVHMSLGLFWGVSVGFNDTYVCHWGTCLHSFQWIIHFLLKWGSSTSEEGLKGGWEQAFILLQQQLVIWGVYAPVGRRETRRKARRVLEEWWKRKKGKGPLMQRVKKKTWWNSRGDVEEKKNDLDRAKDGEEGRKRYRMKTKVDVMR